LGAYHHGHLIAVLAALVLAFEFVLGTVLVYKIYSVDDPLLIRRFSWLLTVTFATMTTTDMVIAGAICYFLRKSKGLDIHYNSRISRAMQYILGSGLLTTAFSLSCLFTWIFLPNTLNYQALGFFLPKLYLTSFMAMLNSRERARFGSLDSPVQFVFPAASESSWKVNNVVVHELNNYP